MKLWKICRVLENPMRFALLRTVSLSPQHALNVMQVAERAGQKKSVTSQYLKQLAEAGLLAVERKGSFAICASDHPCRFPLAQLQKALADFFAADPDGAKDDKALEKIHALSHHGRVTIVSKVADYAGGDMPLNELAKSTGFPPATLFRQLGILADAGIIAERKGADGRRAYSLAAQSGDLCIALVSLACDDRLDLNAQGS
jgi:DNA-binding IscR family transcriptional regulator